jgi:hypothetical protein
MMGVWGSALAPRTVQPHIGSPEMPCARHRLQDDTVAPLTGSVPHLGHAAPFAPPGPATRGQVLEDFAIW